VAVGHGDNVIVAGGEINTANTALDVVEAFDLNSETWQSLPPMGVGRHGAGGGIVNARLHMISGASSLGGAQETASHEILQLPVIATLPMNTSKGGSVEWFFLCLLLLGLTRAHFQTRTRRLAVS